MLPTQVWWHMPLISTLMSQRQVDLCESETDLVYKVRVRTDSKATQSPCLENPQKYNKKKKKY